MSKKSIFILIGLVLLATALRLWHLDKPEGMWNDEYLTWQIASASFPFDFFKAINSNCHAPLHYFYLKGWMALFGSSDWTLRLSSVVPGVLAVVVMYLAGLELSINKKDEKHKEFIGLFGAGFCAISSFLIYFSQEVRIYSLTLLLSALLIWFSLRLYNSQTKSNYVFWGVFSVLLMLTHTLGFVFVFFNFVALMVFKLIGGKKKSVMPFVWTTLGVLVLTLPLVPFLVKTFAHPRYFSQWWTPFLWDKVYFYFTDLFSPVVTNITDTGSFVKEITENGMLKLGFVIFALVPTAICLLGFLKSLIKPKKIHMYLFSVLLATFLTVLLASIMGKIVFATKYLIELYPLFILLTASGLASFKSAPRTVLVTIFCFITMFFIIISDTSATKLVRDEGHRLPVVMMEKYGLKKNDKILFLYYPKDRFDKYLDHQEAASVNKYNFPHALKGKEATTFEAFKDGKRLYRDIFLSSKNQNFENFLNDRIYSHLKKGDKLFIVTLKTVSIYSPEVLPKLVKNEPMYEATPFLYILTSYVTNYSLKMARQKLAYRDTLEYANWKIYVFEDKGAIYR